MRIYEEVVALALLPGPASPPINLLSLITESDEPIAYLADFDKIHNALAALYVDFPFLQSMGGDAQMVKCQDFPPWTQLLRWSYEQIRTWSDVSDQKKITFTAIFVVSLSTPWNDRFWPLVPQDASLALLEEVAESLATWCEYGIPDIAALNHHRTEVRDALQRAEGEGDLVAISRCVRPLMEHIYESPLASECARFLSRYSSNKLNQATSNIRSTLVACQIANSLSSKEALLLSGSTSNPLLRLILTLGVAISRPLQQLSSDEGSIMTSTFLTVALNDLEWTSWMEIFASSPLAYPCIQYSLYEALAQVSKASLQSYVKAIQITSRTSHDHSRELSTSCFNHFASHAKEDQRKILWSLIFARWRQWDFGVADESAHLAAVSISNIDRAVVGYIQEVMTDSERSESINMAVKDLEQVNERWYDSALQHATCCYRLGSRLQPYEHARLSLETSSVLSLRELANLSTLSPKAAWNLGVG